LANEQRVQGIAMHAETLCSRRAGNAGTASRIPAYLARGSIGAKAG
jgi:hypothetical protein